MERYCYNLRSSWEGVLAVGWLENGHDFPRGDSSVAFQTKLEAIRQREQVNVYRGYHYCHFCLKQEADQFIVRPRVNAGCSEVWVPRGGVIYASPELVGHYIEAHHYLPPTEFIDAVMEFDLDSHWSGEAIAKGLRGY